MPRQSTMKLASKYDEVMDYSEFVEANNLHLGNWSFFHPPATNFHGNFNSVQVSDFLISRSQADPLKAAREIEEIDADRQTFFCLILVLSGSCVMTQGNEHALISTNDLAIWDSTRPVRMTICEKIDQISMVIPRDTGLNLIDRIEDMSGIPVSGRTALGTILRNHLFDLENNIRDTNQSARIPLLESSLHLVNSTFKPDEKYYLTSTGRSSLSSARKFILRHLRDPELDAAMIANAMGFSRRYLYRIFSRSGCTLNEWIFRRRLLASRADLAVTGPMAASIAQIAMTYGFSDQSHFCRRFKGEFGVSPTQFRNTVER